MNQAEIEALANGMAPAIRDMVERALQPFAQRIAALEARKPEKGEPGLPGKDGFSLESFDCVPLDERTIEMRFTGGGQVHRYELEFPVMVYRDVFKAGETYKHGDAVTWGGSLWIAQKETAEKPDTPDSGWKLAVKKGRDGKDAK